MNWLIETCMASVPVLVYSTDYSPETASDRNPKKFRILSSEFDPAKLSATLVHVPVYVVKR